MDGTDLEDGLDFIPAEESPSPGPISWLSRRMSTAQGSSQTRTCWVPMRPSKRIRSVSITASASVSFVTPACRDG